MTHLMIKLIEETCGMFLEISCRNRIKSMSLFYAKTMFLYYMENVY